MRKWKGLGEWKQAFRLILPSKYEVLAVLDFSWFLVTQKSRTIYKIRSFWCSRPRISWLFMFLGHAVFWWIVGWILDRQKSRKIWHLRVSGSVPVTLRRILRIWVHPWKTSKCYHSDITFSVKRYHFHMAGDITLISKVITLLEK